MVEVINQVAVVERDIEWSRAVVSAFRRNDVEAVQIEPTLGALKPDEVKGRMHIVYVPHLGPHRLQIVRKIHELGGKSLVIPGRNYQGVVAERFLDLKGVYPTTTELGYNPDLLASTAELMMMGKG